MVSAQGPTATTTPLEGGKDQSDAAITAVSLADPGQSQANQQQGVDMSFGARQLFGCDQSPSKEGGIRSVIDRLSIWPQKRRRQADRQQRGSQEPLARLAVVPPSL